MLGGRTVPCGWLVVLVEPCVSRPIRSTGLGRDLGLQLFAPCAAGVVRDTLGADIVARAIAVGDDIDGEQRDDLSVQCFPLLT